MILGAPSVFIAHPQTTAIDLAAIDRLAEMFRDNFLDRGWVVLPLHREPLDAADAHVRIGDGASLLASNVESIVRSDLLLVIATELEEPSSIWVEAGIAIARNVPLVVVADPTVRMPFLVRTATALGAHAIGGRPGRLVLTSSLSAPADQTQQAQAVKDLVDSIIADR